MHCPRLAALGLTLVVGAFCAGTATARAATEGPTAFTRTPLPFEELPARVREQVRRVTEQPTVSARAPAEEFTGRPAMYQWLMDHPDRAAAGWRRLGTPCLDIADRGSGVFGYSDGQGNDIYWETIYRSADTRIWFAEGRARPGLLLPPVPFRAVVVMHHASIADPAGRPRLRHQADFYLHTDSKTASLLARLAGTSAPRLSEQCVGQMQIFFSALTGYMERHPERVEALLFAGERP